jgi:hypothetical protein
MSTVLSWFRLVVDRLSAIPPRKWAGVISTKLLQKTHQQVTKWRSAVFGLAVSPRTLRRRIRASGAEPARWYAQFRDHLRQDALLQRDAIARLPEETRQRILGRAECIRAHEFDLLGSGPVRVTYATTAGVRPASLSGYKRQSGERDRQLRALRELIALPDGYEPIDWHLDFTSGYRWDPRQWHGDIKVGYIHHVDIKVPWELARSHQLVTLAQAHLIAPDHGYATEALAQILDFIEANPVGYGPNWKCPMDVAIRVVNWLVALAVLVEESTCSHAACERVVRSLMDHGRFIRDNLELSNVANGNHLTADYVGLFFLGACCPMLPQSADWRRVSRDALEDLIQHQTYPDGCNFEGSTYYHRLVFELFLYTGLLANRRGHSFSASYWNAIQRMTEAYRGLLLHDGSLPQIGDNDSGRLLAFEDRVINSVDVDYLLVIADAVLGAGNHRYRPGADFTAVSWLFPDWQPMGGHSDWLARSSHHFSDAGWVVLRNPVMEAVISAGPNGQNGNGGHAHNDKLGMMLSVEGRPFVVDPGTYAYTNDHRGRNHHRSTSSHSTPQRGELEQCPLVSGRDGLFFLKDTARARVLTYAPDVVRAVHTGFGDPVALELTLSPHAVSGRYHLSGAFHMRWHLHPDVTVHPADDHVVLANGPIQMVLRVAGATLAAVPGWCSLAYGHRTPTTVLVTTASDVLEWTLTRI